MKEKDQSKQQKQNRYFSLTECRQDLPVLSITGMLELVISGAFVLTRSSPGLVKSYSVLSHSALKRDGRLSRKTWQTMLCGCYMMKNIQAIAAEPVCGHVVF